MSTEASDSEFLRRLVGLELSAVTFIRDYLQLQFESDAPPAQALLTVVTSPTITGQKCAAIDWADPLFSHIIRGQISARVIDARIDARSLIAITLDSGTVLVVPLVPEFLGAAESVLLQFGDDLMVI